MTRKRRVDANTEYRIQNTNQSTAEWLKILLLRAPVRDEFDRRRAPLDVDDARATSVDAHDSAKRRISRVEDVERSRPAFETHLSERSTRARDERATLRAGNAHDFER